MPSTALFTDQYELTMLAAALADGTADTRVAFEVFARRLPAGRRYGVLAGTERLLESIERFRFTAEDLDHLRTARVVDERTADWLAGYRFGGDLDGYAEGEAFVDNSPVLTVTGTFGECVLLETLVLSTLNADSAVASAAARMARAAGDRPCIEMGSRRTHELAAVSAARAAYLAGFTATSNLAAGRRWGIPTAGTSAHAFTLLHGDERAAFASQVAALGAGTTLLVDTYDVETGIRNAVAAAGTDLGAVRLDSGDLREQVCRARALLDSLGATGTKVVVTSDLDEWMIATLAADPVDSYGVGTRVVTGSGAPTAGFVYKMVAREQDGVLRPVAKRSAGKAGVGGRKWATRELDGDGRAVRELVWVDAPPPPDEQRPLVVPLVRAGQRVNRDTVTAARERWRASAAELPEVAFQISAGEPALPTVFRHPEEGP